MRYILKNYNKDYLLKKGFKPMGGYDCDNCFIYKFPVNKHNGKVTLECIVIVDVLEHIIKVDVKDMNSNTFYAPFYHDRFGNYNTILETIYNSINKKFKFLGIKKYRKRK